MDDLGLGLCLGNGTSAAAGGGGGGSHYKLHWIDLPGTSMGETTEPLVKGIDVNRVPTVEKETEEDAVVSSPNSTVSSVSGKRGQREGSENDRAFSNGGLGTSDDEDMGYGSRKKLRLSKDQSAVLEESFKQNNTLNPKQKLALAKQLNLRPRQVEVWFQNRRARTKLKQTEVDCELLKRCCENLKEENRRLQKEVQELRALKLSPQYYMQMTPPTTLTMCTSCERVAASSNTSGATAAARPPGGTAAPRDQMVSGHHPRISSANATSGVNRQYQQQPFFRQVGDGPALLWAPTPLRTVKFLDTLAAHRS